MEQKNIDKIKKAALEIIQQEKEINDRYHVFVSEFFTPDICEMAKVIIDAKHTAFTFDFPDFQLLLTDTVAKIKPNDSVYDTLHIPRSDMLDGSFVHKDDYTDFDVAMIVKHSKRIKDRQYWMNGIYYKLDKIIAGITDQYKEITERQSDQLDEVLSSLGVENEPIKHIRVTVEWL